MEAIKDMGHIQIHSQRFLFWIIPNFYYLPQNHDTVIRSPHFRIEDRDWYMEIYPNGRRLYSSLGWFGFSALDLNSESCVRGVSIGVTNIVNMIYTKEESHGDGFYCCTRLIPASLFNSWKDIFAPEGDLRLFLNIHGDEDNHSVDTIYFNLRTDDVQKLFQENFEEASIEASVQAEEKSGLPIETTVGELTNDSRGVNWIIPNFSDLLHKYDTVIQSPHFHYRDRDWYMEVYPTGRRFYSSLGWFGIGVCNLNPGSILRCITVTVLKETCKITVAPNAFSKNKGFYCCSKLLPTSLLRSWQDIIAEGGNLHLIFGMDDDTANTITMDIPKETMLKLYNRKFQHEETFIETSGKTEGQTGIEKLIKDFQEILQNGNISDIVLKVKNREYKAHRCILAARSPVFLAMMSHDTKERNTGVVDIPDSDPNSFSDFLNYLYTGSVSNLTSENAMNLYTMADKYQVNELKENCKDHMMTNISIDNFCDVFSLSLQHDEKELKDACIQYFAKYSLDIIETCKWQTFLCENPITGNELFIKHLKLNK